MPGHLTHHSTGRESGVRFYPSDLDRGPFMKFTTYEVNGGVGSGLSDINFSLPLEHVCLPIPSGLNNQYGQSWDQKDVSVGESVGGEVAEMTESGELSALGKDLAKGLTKMAFGSVHLPLGVQGAKETRNAIAGFLKGASGGKTLKDAMAAGGVFATGALMGAQSQRALGKVAFSNSYMTYGGPSFRQFSFSYSLKALSESDTEAIDDIVQFFKENSAPEVISGGLWRIYKLPRVFTPSFYTKDGHPNSNLPVIGKCALTNVNVAYGGSKYSEFENSAPVQVDLALTFKEMGLLTQDHLNMGY